MIVLFYPIFYILILFILFYVSYFYKYLLIYFYVISIHISFFSFLFFSKWGLSMRVYVYHFTHNIISHPSQIWSGIHIDAIFCQLGKTGPVGPVTILSNEYRPLDEKQALHLLWIFRYRSTAVLSLPFHHVHQFYLQFLGFTTETFNAAVSKLGAVDIFVNNAAIANEGIWEKMIAINQVIVQINL